jgi:hypothetical protein
VIVLIAAQWIMASDMGGSRSHAPALGGLLDGASRGNLSLGQYFFEFAPFFSHFPRADLDCSVLGART